MKKMKRITAIILSMALIFTLWHSPSIRILADSESSEETLEVEEASEEVQEKETESVSEETSTEEPTTEEVTEVKPTESPKVEVTTEENTESVVTKEVTSTEEKVEEVSKENKEKDDSSTEKDTKKKDTEDLEIKSHEGTQDEGKVEVKNAEVEFLSSSAYHHKNDESNIIYYRNDTKIKVDYELNNEDKIPDGFTFSGCKLGSATGIGDNKNEFYIRDLSGSKLTFKVIYTKTVDNNTENKEYSVTKDFFGGYKLEKVSELSIGEISVKGEINSDSFTETSNITLSGFPEDVSGISGDSTISVGTLSSVTLKSVTKKGTECSTALLSKTILDNYIINDTITFNVKFISKYIPDYTVDKSASTKFKGSADIVFRVSQATGSNLNFKNISSTRSILYGDSITKNCKLNISYNKTNSAFAVLCRINSGRKEYYDNNSGWTTLDSSALKLDTMTRKLSYNSSCVLNASTSPIFTPNCNYFVIGYSSSFGLYATSLVNGATMKFNSGSGVPLDRLQTLDDYMVYIDSIYSSLPSNRFYLYDGLPEIATLRIGSTEIAKGTTTTSNWINCNSWNGGSRAQLVVTKNINSIEKLYFGDIQVPFIVGGDAISFAIPEDYVEGVFPSNKIKIVDYAEKEVEGAYAYKSDITKPVINSFAVNKSVYQKGNDYYIVSKGSANFVLDVTEANQYTSKYNYSETSVVDTKETSVDLDVKPEKTGIYTPYVEDEAGNVAESLGGYSIKVVIDEKEPSLTVKGSDDYKLRLTDNSKWYADYFNYEVEATDEAIKSISSTVNDKNVDLVDALDAKINVIEPSRADGETSSVKGKISLSKDNVEEYVSKLEVKVEDFNSKDKTFSEQVYIDKEKPLNPEVKLNKNGFLFDDKVYFSENPVATISYEDLGSGVKEVILYKGEDVVADFYQDNTDGSTDGKAPTDNFYPITEDLTYTITSSGIYSVEVIDLVGNTTGKLSLSDISSLESSSLVLDSEDPTITTKRPDGDKNDWFANDVVYNVVLNDNIGINNAKVYINEKEVSSFKAEKEGVKENTLKGDTSLVKPLENGSYNVKVTVEDNSGRTSEWSDTIYIDTTKPTIKKIVLTGEGYQEGVTTNTKGDTYGFYFKGKSSCEVYVEDGTVSSGLNKVYYTIKPVKGKQTEGSVMIKGGSATFNLPEDFKGWITVTADDTVGNMSDSVTPDGVINETSKVAINNIGIKINMPETSYKDVNGNTLYSKNIDVTADITSSLSGIRSIEWGVNDSTKGKIVVDNKGSVSGSGATIKGKENNLVVNLINALESSDNQNKNRIWVKVTDRAGYESSAEKIFSIDKDKPTVTVTYDKNNSSTYYNTTRVATITIKERNFSPSKVSITGNKGTLGDWSHDGNTHVARMTFEKDGDYNINVSATDLAGNSSNIVTGNKFTIDKTKPEISVSWSNNSPKNGKYYNSSRTATITVKEHNFDPSAIKVDGGSVGGWSNNGDSHTASVSFTTNGTYKITVSGQDKAGNVGTTYTSEEFIIDLDKPKLTVSGVQEGTSYHKNVEATVTATDNNLDTKISNVTIEGRRNGKITLVGGFTLSGGTIKMENPPKEEKWDDYYTLKAVATDLSGNSEELELTFSVNRFGSSYQYLDEKSLGVYTNERKDVVINEYNVDEVDTSKSRVVVTLDGNEIEVPEGLVKIKDKGIVDGKHLYEYTIDKSLFEKDGKYVIQIFSATKDGLESDSLSQEYSFVLDTTAPEVIISGVKENKIYNDYEKAVTVEFRDISDVKDVKIKLNGNELQYQEDNGVYKITVPESSRRQTLSVEASDSAGNSVTSEVKNFLITSNKLSYLSHQWWFWAIIAGIVLIIVAIMVLILLARRKRSRKVDEELVNTMTEYNTTGNNEDANAEK